MTLKAMEWSSACVDARSHHGDKTSNPGRNIARGPRVQPAAMDDSVRAWHAYKDISIPGTCTTTFRASSMSTREGSASSGALSER